MNQPPPLPAQISQQLSHPPPPLPSSVSPSGLTSKLSELQISNMTSEEPSPVSAASEYSLFNDNFSKVSVNIFFFFNSDVNIASFCER